MSGGENQNRVQSNWKSESYLREKPFSGPRKSSQEESYTAGENGHFQDNWEVKQNNPFPKAQVGIGGVTSGGNNYLVLENNLLLPFLQKSVRDFHNLRKGNLFSLLSHELTTWGRLVTHHSLKFPDLPPLLASSRGAACLVSCVYCTFLEI